MLAKWLKVLPYFVVVWIAKKKCERFTSSAGLTYSLFSGHFLLVTK